VLVEGAIPHVAPENRGHAQFVRVREGLAHFNDLSVALLRAEVDRCPHSSSTHVVRDFYCGEKHLVELVWIGHEFVVIQIHDEWNFVCVLAADGPEDAAGCRHSVASTFDREFYDIFGIEVVGVFRETCTRGMLDSLVDGKNRKITGCTQPTMR